jgi:HAD superfamily hydrolase (TIGR01490 family)
MSSNTDKIWSFFDLDGTLVNKDSYLPFLLYWKYKHPHRVLPLLFLPIKCFTYLTKHKNRSYLKAAFLSAFMKGAKRSEVDSFVANFWSRFLVRYRNEVVINKLKWHFHNDHRVYIVSGSFDFYTEFLKKIWPVHGIISTRAEWAGDVLTGNIIGKNCKGKEKIIRIEEELGIDLRNVKYYAYTDSYSDLPLLRNATFPIVVRSKISTKFKNEVNISFLSAP